MTRLFAAAAIPALLIGVSACSEETQADAARTADLAADDAEANAEVVGEIIEEGAKDAAGAVSEGAGNLEQRLEAGDTEEPGPAPITGDDLNENAE